MGFIYSIPICAIFQQTFGPSHQKCPTCPMIFVNTVGAHWVLRNFIRAHWIFSGPGPKSPPWLLMLWWCKELSQGISSHSIDLILLEYSVLSTRKVNTLYFHLPDKYLNNFNDNTPKSQIVQKSLRLGNQCIRECSHHWCRWWLVTFSSASHYLDQCRSCPWSLSRTHFID